MELTLENVREMIYYDFRRGLSRQKCINQLISSFGDEAPSYATVKRWYNEFDCSRHSLTETEHIINEILGLTLFGNSLLSSMVKAHAMV